MGFVKIDFIIIKCLFKQMPPPFHTPGDQGGGGSSNNLPPQQWKHAETLTQPECEERGAKGKGDKPPPHSEQGMYENSCINLSSPPAPRLQQGPEENDAKEKLNPMSKIRQTQLLLSAHRPRVLARRAAGRGVRRGAMGWGQARFGLAFLLPRPVRWKREGGSWAEALSMYIYIHSSPPGWGAQQNPVQTFLQGGKT